VSARIGAYAMKGGGGRYHTNPVLSGGGIVMELGVHLLDQVAFVTAATAVDLEAVTGVVENGLDHHVSCAGSLHVDGRVVPVDATVSRLQNMDGGVALRFDRGEVRFGVEPCSGVYLTQDGNPDVFRLDIQVNRSGLPTAQTAGRAFDAIWESFLGGLRRDEVTPAAAATGRITTQWVEAIYRGLPRG
jgi:predicted dehydrogenase